MSDKALTIIVPAKPENFSSKSRHWKAIRIAKKNWASIKYIAIYQSGKVAKITHFAEVKDIVRLPKNPDEKSPKCKINIQNSWKPVNCEKRQKGDVVVRSSRYSAYLDFNNHNTVKYSDFFK